MMINKILRWFGLIEYHNEDNNTYEANVRRGNVSRNIYYKLVIFIMGVNSSGLGVEYLRMRH